MLNYAATEDEIQQWYRTTAPFYDPAELGFVGSQVQQLADKWTGDDQKTVDDKNVATRIPVCNQRGRYIRVCRIQLIDSMFSAAGQRRGDGTTLFVVDTLNKQSVSQRRKSDQCRCN